MSLFVGKLIMVIKKDIGQKYTNMGVTNIGTKTMPLTGWKRDLLMQYTSTFYLFLKPDSEK
ncbi:hypothetical protein BK702_02940 [Bacillus thuringiensis serovar cameroun]|nr:hypothetical protein BK702_02940 [Bacillus thuringiensis serovar cameroun]